jgi:phosphatidylinositol-3-phosphatase
MITESATPTASPAIAQCAECAARLAHDQRYCVECGARRGPLPADVVELIGAIHEQGPVPALPPETPLAEAFTETAPRPRVFEFSIPGPRAAAATVMGMLGFGVIVGSLVGGTPVETLANAPLIVVGLNHPTPTVPTVQSAASSQDNGSGGGGAGAAINATAAASQPAAQASASPSTSPTSTSPTNTTSTGFAGLPPIKHVFLIVLSDRGFGHSFGAAHGGYLSGALRRQGELVQNYYGVASAPLANEIALISGQGPTPQTASDCPQVSRIKPGTKGPRGQVLGAGCVYPATTHTLPNQLTNAGHSWKAYVQGVSSSSPTACRVPKLGSKESQIAGARATYLAWRNPFVFFRSLTAGTACHKDEVGIGQLANDLKSASSTPSLSYIIPAPCSDGSEAPCKPHAPTGLAAANRFLKTVVPEIKRSAAYQADGLIAITFDQAPQAGADADSSACCSSPATFPNLRSVPAPPVPPAAMGSGATSTTTGSTTTGSTTTSTTSTTGSTTTPTTSTPTTSTTGSTTTPTTTGTTSTTPTTGSTTTGSTTTPSTTGSTTTTGTTTTGTTTTGTTTTPASSSAGGISPTGGGGQVGLLLISQYVKPNSVDVVDYFNHFSLLASIEKLFGLHRLGYGGVSALPVFGAAVFNQYAG